MKLSGIDTQKEIMIDTRLLHPRSATTITISQGQYDQWRAGFVFDGLRNLRYGQSFCNHFDITDYRVYHAQTMSEADMIIRGEYVR
jgi:hypothetical protein